MFVQLLKDHIGCKSGERIDVSPDDGAYMVQKGIAQPMEDPITPLVAKGIEGVIAKMQEARQFAIDRLVGKVEPVQGGSGLNCRTSAFRG
jgi:hypothetical protein